MVPHLEDLTIEHLLDFAKSKPLLLKYLPAEKDWLHIDRQWLCDVLYTLDQDGLDELIQLALVKRKDKLELSMNLNVEMRPEFA